MDAPACAVGRLGPDGPWLGFVPTLDDGYALVVGDVTGSRRTAATPDDLVALALAYFEESLDEPPDDLAATHGDIGAIVRHAADRVGDGATGPAFRNAVDAIDDGLAPDVVIERLAHAFGAGVDPIGYLRGRAAELLGA
jgi:hypothetical protein